MKLFIFTECYVISFYMKRAINCLLFSEDSESSMNLKPVSDLESIKSV